MEIGLRDGAKSQEQVEKNNKKEVHKNSERPRTEEEEELKRIIEGKPEQSRKNFYE